MTEIRSVHCTELTATQRGVAVEFTVFGIEHDSEELTFDVLVISSEGIEHAAEITIPARINYIDTVVVTTCIHSYLF